MPNRDSKTNEWSAVVGETAKALERRARELRAAGWSVPRIAALLGKSQSRIYEYLRADDGTPRHA